MNQTVKTSLLVLIGLLAVFMAVRAVRTTFNPECRDYSPISGEDVPCYMGMDMVKTVATWLGLGLGFYYVQKLPVTK